MVKAFFIAVTLAFTLIPCLLRAGGGTFNVVWKEQRLSVTADGIPLAQVVAEIARRTAMRVEGAGELTQETQVQFSALPLSEGLGRLLRGTNFAIMEHPAGPGGVRWITLVVFNQPRAQTVARDVANPRPRPGDKSLSGPALQGASGDDPAGHLNGVYEAAQRGDLAALWRAALGADDASRNAAFELLAQKDPVQATGMAVTASASSDLGERLSGLGALAHIDNALAADVLGGALSDPDTGVKQIALWALSAQTGPEATRFLTQAAEDPDPYIRSLASNLLESRGYRVPNGSASAEGDGTRAVGKNVQ